MRVDPFPPHGHTAGYGTLTDHTRHREGYRGSPVKQSCIILGTIILRAKGLEIITGDIVAIGIFTAWCQYSRHHDLPEND